MRLVPMVGRSFGRLTVIAREGHDPVGATWRCRCMCGTETVVSGLKLRSGRTRSCGCLALEMRTKHGHARTGLRSPEYVCWFHIIQRCTQPSCRTYRNYGGRGIQVCVRWLRFENFLADMGRRPAPHLSIDRINNDGNYEPSNCRWATRSEQARNKRPRKVA